MTTTGAASPLLGDGLVGLLLSREPSIERLPVDVLSPEQAAAELERVQARKAMDAAYEAELVMVLAAARPDTDDPPPGHPGAAAAAHPSRARPSSSPTSSPPC